MAPSHVPLWALSLGEGSCLTQSYIPYLGTAHIQLLVNMEVKSLESVPQFEIILKGFPSFRAPSGLSYNCFTKSRFPHSLMGVLKCASQLTSCIQISISESVSQGPQPKTQKQFNPIITVARRTSLCCLGSSYCHCGRLRKLGKLYWLLQTINEHLVAEPGLNPHLLLQLSFSKESWMHWKGMPPSQHSPYCSQTGLSLPQTGWALCWFRAFDFAVTSFLETFSWLDWLLLSPRFQLHAASSGKTFWNASTKGISPTSFDFHLSHLLAYFFQWPYFTLNYPVCLCLLHVTIFYFFSPLIECKLQESRNGVYLVHCCFHCG